MRADHAAMFAAHRASTPEVVATMGVFCNQNAGTIAVMLKSWERKVVRYVKGAPNSEFTHIDAGISVFERSALQEIPLHQNVALDQFFSSWAATGRLGAFLVRQRFYETGSWAGSSDFEKFIADGGDSAS